MKTLPFLLFLITTLFYGQVSKLKYVFPTVEDEGITSGIVIAGKYFFAYSVVDTHTIPAGRSAFIIQVDDSLNVIAKVKISPDSLHFSYINRLFPLLHPITKELVIGFIGWEIKLGNSPGDSVSSMCMGYVTTDFKEIKYYTGYSPLPPVYSAVGFPGFRALNVEYVKPVNDTSFMFIRNVYSMNPPLVKDTSYLIMVKYDTTGFYMIDSVYSDTLKYSHIFQLSNGNYYLFALKPNGLCYTTWIKNLFPLAVDTPKIYKGLQTNVYHYNGTIAFDVYNDTLFGYGFVQNIDSGYKYFYKFIPDSNTGIKLHSFQLVGNYVIGQGYGSDVLPSWGFKTLSYPNFYVVDDRSGDGYFLPTLWNHDWIHYSYDTMPPIEINYINLQDSSKSWFLTLNNKRLYEVFGSVVPNDSTLILYGWTFPLKDLNRTDGEAFLWRIDNNSYITVSLNPIKDNYKFSVFIQNPVENILKIKVKNLQNYYVKILSLDGKLLKVKYFREDGIKFLDISDLPTGIYIITIENKELTLSRKIVKL